MIPSCLKQFSQFKFIFSLDTYMLDMQKVKLDHVQVN